LDVELLKLEEQLGTSKFKITFNTLTFGHNFREAILTILKQINELTINFTNVQLVSEDCELFTSILPQ